jgi:hypothetical protein
MPTPGGWQCLSRALWAALLLLLVLPGPIRAAENDRAGEREAMLETIEAHAAAAGALGAAMIEPRVLEALRRVRRHLFAPRSSSPTPTRTDLCRSVMVRPSRSRSSWR